MNEVCSHCGVREAGPYCLVVGAVHHPFRIGGRYDVDHLLRASVASFVFAAVDRTNRREVAVKVLRSDKADALPEAPGGRDQQAQRRFQHAAATLANLPIERASGILNVGRDDALGATFVVIDREGLSMDELGATAWSLDVAIDTGSAKWRRLDDRGAPPVGSAAEWRRGSFDAQETAPTGDMHDPYGDPDDRMPRKIGSYRVVRELGAGGTGRVYLGEHPVIGSKVAIKVLLPDIARHRDTVERFMQEARASSQIASPHIPKFFDFGTTTEGLPYAVMEYCEGETLGRRLARTRTVSIEDAAQIIDQVASALEMAHGAGLIHRDLKPENLLLVDGAAPPPRLSSAQATALGGEHGKRTVEVKVLDFGIAKAVGQRSAAQTQNGAFLGTPYYCAPEQVFGHAVDARTDVYSLGATAYEMLTGTPPFVGEVPEILSAKVTQEAPDAHELGVPMFVADTIRMMMAREPRDRAPSMAWVRAQVARWTMPASDDDLAIPMSAARTQRRTGLERAPTARPDEHVESSARDANLLEASLVERSREIPMPATASEQLEVPPPRRRGRWVLVIGGALAAAAAAAVLVLRPTTPSTSGASVRPSAPSGVTVRPSEAPKTAPTEPAIAPAIGPKAEPTKAVAPEVRVEKTLDATTSGEPPHEPAKLVPPRTKPRPPRARPTTPTTTTTTTGPKRPPAKPPTDMLIVDPFSHN